MISKRQNGVARVMACGAFSENGYRQVSVLYPNRNANKYKVTLQKYFGTV